MRSGSNAYTAAGQPAFVAAPGNYILKLVVASGNGTCTGTPLFSNAALTYLLVGTL